MVSTIPQSTAGAPLSIGGEVAPGLLGRLASAHGLSLADWDIPSAEQGGLKAGPDILVTLRGCAREMEAALGRGGVRAYLELGDGEELPAGLMPLMAEPSALHLSFSTVTSFSLDMAPVLCATLVARGWLDERRRADAEICVHEAVSNAIVHGNLDIQQGPTADVGAFDGFFRTIQERLADRTLASRRVTVEAVAGADELCVSVKDEGRGHPGHIPSMVDKLEAKSGRGIRIMGEMANRVSFADGGRTTNLYFRR